MSVRPSPTPSPPDSAHPLHAAARAAQPPSSTLSRRRRAGEAAAADEGTALLRPPRGAPVDEQHKGHATPPAATALERLETLFGLSPQPDAGAAFPASALASSSRTPEAAPAPASRLVLQHAVGPSDTLAAIALRYGVEERLVRASNGLWPGDSVQARRVILLPLEACTRGVPDAARAEAGSSSSGSGAADGQSLTPQLRLLDAAAAQEARVSAAEAEASESAHHAPQRSLSTRASSTSLSLARSHAHTRSVGTGDGGNSPAPRVRRLKSSALSFFPPGGARTRGEDEADEAHAKEEERVAPGESGVDDLIQLAERARLRQDVAPGTNGHSAPAVNALPLNRSPAVSARELDDDDEETPWKANRWRFGNASSSSSSGNRPAPTSTPSASSSSGYLGWNDAPEIAPSSNSASRAARNARARRPAATAYVVPATAGSSSSSGLFGQIAAGLPANDGAAANWQRPIHASVPLPAAAAAASARAAGQKRSDWGALVSDAIRGRVSLEDAWSSLSAPSRPPPPARATSAQSGTSTAPPLRLRPPDAAPSDAAAARKSLSRAAGAEVREALRADSAELERLQPPPAANSLRGSSGRGGEMGRRRGIVDVDWTS
ncbi:hypothetical protein FA09DRAFT_361278 [Tilletiopsis washingtonensis]|jgi:hypothetical protein|uniref:LysM domain-containing protein n=1 Tax=Tilletiopsis washingtonensis TaxID=58919 RepID=A0A316ZB35_9BASI|nr:hypothetical protein FA09DRAFT_361278 [Tilletiopsis washingtonensis]PWN97475.1 hypothetical protein FA09DRAFT_361278 [Tilletiopsis washingtonensis]